MPNQLSGSSAPWNSTYGMVEKLVQRYNDDPRKFSDNDADLISLMADQYGLEFHPPQKSMDRAIYSFANMATFGLVPESMRPRIAGGREPESKIPEYLGGGAGTVIPGAFALKGLGKLSGAAGRTAGNLYGAGRNLGQSAMDYGKLSIGKGTQYARNSADAIRIKMSEARASRLAQKMKDPFNFGETFDLTGLGGF